MATLFAHAALPLVAKTAFTTPYGTRRRLAVLAVVCACVPDLDMVTFAFEYRSTDPIGHRGLSHSLFTAFVIALLVSLIGFRRVIIGSRTWWKIFAFLFAATASHGLLDAMTNADVGVALFAPFVSDRYFFPCKILPSCQAGLNEYFSFWGALSLANEILYVVLPIALVVSVIRPDVPSIRARASARTRTLAGAAIWLVVVLLVRRAIPEYFAPTVPRVLMAVGTPEAGDPNDIPRADLPNGILVRSFDDFRALGLFETQIEATNPDWSSSFFPSWFGGEAGRWADAKPRLVWRTIFGFAPPTAAAARGWLEAAAKNDPAAEQRLFTLAPAEKVDLALGRLDFPATIQGLSHSHNGTPRYWSGRCNGVAAAAMSEPEPFRVVDVTSVDGFHIRFHPNDIKSLLSVAYYESQEHRLIGADCNTVSFDPGVTCSMSPAVLLMTVLNRIGVAHQSFLIDALPTIAKQYYAVERAFVHVVRAPYSVDATPMDPSLKPNAASLVDVTIDLTLSSTTLRYARANVLDPASANGTRYERVGVVPVKMSYAATLVLNARGEMIGGRWTGDPPDGPDHVMIEEGGPELVNGEMLASADRMPWPFIRELARASVDDASEVPSLDLRTQCGGRCP